MTNYDIKTARTNRAHCKWCHRIINTGEKKLFCDFGYKFDSKIKIAIYLCKECGTKNLKSEEKAFGKLQIQLNDPKFSAP